MQLVKYDESERIAFITINRPEKRNALSPDLVTELKECFNKAENSKEAKVVILKAEGKAFCAGADLQFLQDMQNFSYDENLADSKNLMELFSKVYNLKKPVIAQVEGHAIAGGAGLATVCDFVFSVPDIKYGYTEVKIGFIPAIVSIFLLRKIGETKSKELLLSGELISSQKAAEYNIFNFIYPKEDIENEVLSFAKKIIETTSTDSLELTKKLISDVQNLSLDDALNYAAELNAKSRNTKDCKKGIDAFLSNKKISW